MSACILYFERQLLMNVSVFRENMLEFEVVIPELFRCLEFLGHTGYFLQ